ncbi:phosphatase PAP2 family protein [Cesiribacter andamanensis]|uniref:PAP2 (Acid phosphatase) superfamily protein n=1 Tax=Cesiribacter andamanensis AMV16 TaxID=1279009 RepID=M7N0M3_9BACT|nr:phosphatase PAP2 family protein [Cesiribacter andamanensis]EMR00852.1 PAP2 (acid phosphatase) superfamily protein [Cesiribacter andamanensis AMV16]
MKRVPPFLLPLLWLSLWASPLLGQEQPTRQPADSAAIIPADSVLPGQKEPFTDAQRLEGFNQRYLKRAVLPSALLIGAGIYTIQGRGFFSSQDLFDYRSRTFPNFSTNADDFAMLAPLVGLYGINIISSQNRHELGRQTLLLVSSGVLTTALVWPTKAITNIDRPNGKPHAFPSGHTAYAFTIATFMDKEFRHKSPWISVASYSIAGATGVLRVLNNAHWMSDVLAGAGAGILSVNTVYWLHAKLKPRDKGLNTTMLPLMLPNGQLAGLQLYVRF